MERGAFFWLFSIFFCSLSFFLSSWTYGNAYLYNDYNIAAVFAFGDSTLDTGNNNDQNTLFKGNHLPYGRDFPGHLSTGRFSNGKILPDFVVSLLGLKDLLPAYLDPNVTDTDLLTGVSFASSGSGLDIEMNPVYNVTNMSTQLDYFQECLERIRKLAGENNIVGNSLIIISIGSVDMLSSYYDLRVRRLKYSVSNYHDLLLGNLEPIIQRLYQIGARKIVISGLSVLGCLPFQKTLSTILLDPGMSNNSCVDQQNYDSQAYNIKLQDLIKEWQASLPNAKVAYANIYDPLMNIILNPNQYGMEVVNRGCCGNGWIELGFLCNSGTSLCSDATKYLFWDAVHPTQAATRLLQVLSMKLYFHNSSVKTYLIDMIY